MNLHTKIYIKPIKQNPNQMLQILSIALPQVKSGNTLKNLLNEIRQIIYSLHREKEIT